MRYYISDLHFGDEDVWKLMDKREFNSLEDMNETMILRWNNKIINDKNAEIFVLGDMMNYKTLSTQGINKILHRLRGKIYLVTGNHDAEWLKKPGIDQDRFAWIKPYAEIKDTGRELILCHYPIPFFGKSKSLRSDGSPRVWMLHGHTHNSYEEIYFRRFVSYMRKQPIIDRRGNHRLFPMNVINCFCMKSDYRPLTLDEWIALEQTYTLPDVITKDMFD